jgi:hypothetical protein
MAMGDLVQLAARARVLFSDPNWIWTDAWPATGEKSPRIMRTLAEAGTRSQLPASLGGDGLRIGVYGESCT